MVAADSPFQSVADMDGATICVASGTTTEGNVAPRVRTARHRAGRGAFLPGPRAHPGGLPRRSVRRVVVRHVPAHRPAIGVPERARRRCGSSRTSFSKEPLAPAVRRRRDRARAGGGLGDLRDHPGRGVRDHLAEHRRVRRQRGPERPDLPRARPRRAAPSTRASACPRTSRSRSSPRSGTTARSSRSTSRRSVSSGALNALWTDGGLLYAPPYR